MKLNLSRFAYTDSGTFGFIRLHDHVFYTVEKPWRNNIKSESCVPEGTYNLLWLPTTTSIPDSYHGHTWYLQGETVSIEYDSHKPRSRCCIHVGNTSEDVHGCIAVGKELATINNKLGVRDSRKALDTLLTLIEATDHELSIRNLV